MLLVEGNYPTLIVYTSYWGIAIINGITYVFNSYNMAAKDFTDISRHTVVCHVTQEVGTPCILTGSHFHTYVALRSLTSIQPNLLQRCLPGRQVYIPNLKQITPANAKIQVRKISFFLFFFI